MTFVNLDYILQILKYILLAAFIAYHLLFNKKCRTLNCIRATMGHDMAPESVICELNGSSWSQSTLVHPYIHINEYTYMYIFIYIFFTLFEDFEETK